MGDNEIDFKPADPQVVVQGRLKQGENSDIIVFRLNFYILELLCIVTVPNEGSNTAPVYVKFKIKENNSNG